MSVRRPCSRPANSFLQMPEWHFSRRQQQGSLAGQPLARALLKKANIGTRQPYSAY